MTSPCVLQRVNSRLSVRMFGESGLGQAQSHSYTSTKVMAGDADRIHTEDAGRGCKIHPWNVLLSYQ